MTYKGILPVRLDETDHNLSLFYIPKLL